MTFVGFMLQAFLALDKLTSCPHRKHIAAALLSIMGVTGFVVQAGNTQFTPHYMSRECTSCLESLVGKNNCIHYGRYCSMDSIGDEYKDTFKGWQASLASCHFAIYNFMSYRHLLLIFGVSLDQGFKVPSSPHFFL